MINIHNAIKKWTDENKPVGEMLGYPDCCVASFCKQPPQLLKGQPTKDDIGRYKAGCIAGNFTGFIPCAKHARKIAASKITLQSLIDLGKRDLFVPGFPNA